MVRMPGVSRPEHATWLLTEVLEAHELGPGTRVLDLCSGAGAVTLRASSAGAGWVTAIDASPLAAATTWINAKLGGQSVRVVRGDLTEPVKAQRFDLVVADPPRTARYAATPEAHRVCAAADRDLVERICRQAPELLEPHGVLLLARVGRAEIEHATGLLEREGLRVEIAAERVHASPRAVRTRGGARGGRSRGAATVTRRRRDDLVAVLRATVG
ncbi:methyltransferase domain-containing protein [Rhodococcus rhodnii]|uniref:Methyltransferase domain-containing protein n=3 Tax=Rhodococcus rhodnii TaxID=38312 RepID=A0A6P2CGM6_9NOCA|nr:methyltransferase domain-containing protein [Rhodococcus rhodnii]